MVVAKLLAERSPASVDNRWRDVHMRSFGIALAIALFLVTLIPAAGSAQEGGLAARVAELEEQVAAMEEILEFVYVEMETINGLAGPHVIIEGANVHVRSGSGFTTDLCSFHDPNCGKLTGLGNFIVGYNEPRPPRHPGDPPQEDRTGSHNLVVGEWHSYASFAGFVAGRGNRLIGPHASVSGGLANHASGPLSSVSGGHANVASGDFSSVSGGQENDADGVASSISGGLANEANGFASSVNGGFMNSANGHESSIGGGNRNDAIGDQSWISGGKANVAAGTFSSVSGGWSNEAVGQFSSLSGGRDRTVLGDFNWAAGSLFEPN
jgi:hypothetical protein